MTPDELERHLIGVSPAMQAVRDLVRRLAPSSLAVLLQGPTGVGKELVAQALHEFSGRPGPLVSVNSAAIPDSMFEAEMFGYVKGAFSGAFRDRLGFLAEAHCGTLFLDEVGSLSLVMQPKLLRALETRQYRSVGARVDRCSDFRIIAAANEDIDTLVSMSRFRADLMHRLRGAVIWIPGLDRRREDVPVLARHFAALLRHHDGPVEIMEDAMRELGRRTWPGNVRELKHVIQCAVALALSPRISRADVALAGTTPEFGIAPIVERDLERRRLVDALTQCDWVVGETAVALGIHRVTLSRHMHRLGIQRPSRISGRESLDASGPSGGAGES